MAQQTDEALLELNISAETVAFIIMKAREFDAKPPPDDADPGSTPAEDGAREALDDYADDPTLAELQSAIDELNDDETIDLIALAWVGRGDFDQAGWDEARALADERHQRRSGTYLCGMPALGDYLEEGLAALGYSIAEFESGHQ